ncbi:1-aminocyclopropane-1-carboxylate deaminase/D-cysteine desulfhydrase [Riemerella columbina]|uniref:1-aminocyclopropane-1-carboxylate deaminase/D-cysteine desulfhydrase n=1 Tax=Riemerella columbina TaxID=103810 RepID=UPI00266F885A|nr:pyridoxal-phosphate dependent enzyme [Riemerella columbina]WKS95770.1 pyridoxal-phosphate dependent enzyme [Riemerella columbina]
MGVLELLNLANLPDRPLISIPLEHSSVALYIKREDRVHPEISGNKFWKLWHNIHYYLHQKPKHPLLITFGGAFSNHIAATAALGRLLKIPTIGIIRGEEWATQWQDNPTLAKAYADGMRFQCVSRTTYRDKAAYTELLKKDFPEALIIPEGGSNALGVQGIQHMLNEETKTFDYLCTAVGTGGTVAGLSKYAAPHQQVLGFKVVNDTSLEAQVKTWSGRENTTLIDAFGAGYGKISVALVDFINGFYQDYQQPLDPIYTGKMMMQLLQMIAQNKFPEGSRILAFHTGGLQGIIGANKMLKKQNRNLINIQL